MANQELEKEFPLLEHAENGSALIVAFVRRVLCSSDWVKLPLVKSALCLPIFSILLLQV
ncbi:hypothetical protein ACLOJK_000974 [Asimina triloba]